jgi:tRNA nucleotidyltransferase/poly(A) polymerase
MEPTRLSCPASEQPWRSGIRCLLLLRAAGHQAYLVGGCVRDLILGRAVKDADVATSARPEEVERLCREAQLRCVPVGRSFGVVVAVCDGIEVEIATFRRDGSSQDGRHPDSVAYTLSAAEDAARRDFTVNALFYDPLDGQLIDHVGGRRDLEARLLRTVGDARQRLAEDRLRVLRGLRFAAQLGLTIEDASWAGLCATTLDGLSAERLMQEWFKGLEGEHRGSWLALLAGSGQLARLCPPLGPLGQGDLARLGAHLDALGAASAALAAAVWLLPGGPAGLAWLARQPLSGERVARISWLVEHALQAGALAGGPLVARRRVLQHQAAGELVQLLRSDPAAGSEAAQLDTAFAAEAAQAPWRPLLRAGDLLALGAHPGPALGQLLRRLEDAQLDGRLASRDQALAQAAAWLAGPAER